ncbi:MAG: hypothetical protein PHI68_02890 [Candidatus Cloacimonetes bacterium]|nr:hypothetical protein [Candidatus Cloacimonadota bacterium]
MNPKWNKVTEYVASYQKSILQIAIYDLHAPREQCVIIFESEPQDLFEITAPLNKYLKRSKLALPLIINREFIRQSLDSYPLEFLSIQSDYENLYCQEDILASLQFQPADIRLQMERELKSKWLLTRQAIFENPGNYKHIHHILHLSLEALMPIFKGFFQLKKLDIPQNQDLIFQLVNEMTVFDLSPLKSISQVPHKELKLVMIYQYLDLLAAFSRLMETWDYDQKPL